LRRYIGPSAVALATVYVIITISFLFVHYMPGDPLIHLIGQEDYYYLLDASPETLDAIANRYGLNESLWAQYTNYLHSVITLDFGTSFTNHRPVLENVLSASRWTLALSLPTLILASLIGGACGLLAGWKPGGVFDKASTPVILVLNTIPSNCIALILLVVMAYRLRVLPINGMVSPGLEGSAWFASVAWHMVLPLAVLVLGRSASNYMLMKGAASQVRHEEYTLTATSKGLAPRHILFRHVARGAMLPYLTSICLQMGGLLSGSMIVEVVFGWKGMGKLLYDAVQSRDFPTAQLCFLVSAVLVVAVMLLADVLNLVFDPRLREAAGRD